MADRTLHGLMAAIAEGLLARVVFSRLAWLLVLLQIGAHAAPAAAVRAEVIPIATRVRTGAPSLVDVKLSLAGAGLVQGRLELTLSRFGSIAAVVRSHEIVVPAGGLSMRMVLPPLPGEGELIVTARMLTKGGILPAGESRLWGLPESGQNFLTAVVGSRTAAREGDTRLWQELRLERFGKADETRVATWSTTPAFLEPAELPDAALAWCAFDLVLLEGESFGRLRSRQLDALVQWVEGGGSVFIAGAGRISPDHLRALNRLIPHPPDGRAFQCDETGKLTPPALSVIRARSELGRCVLAVAPPQQSVDFATPEWREASAFLWKMSTAWFDLIRRGEPRIGAYDGRIERAYLWENAVAERLQSLIPRTVRMLPPGVIASILAGFALAVGPGEWFVLGWLRLRRWTWLVFPLSATAFTGATIFAANYYLGRKDHRVAIVVTDIGRGNRVLRESQIEMLMAGAKQTHQSELTRTLKTPTSLASRMSYHEGQTMEPPTYDGQHPLRFTFSQQLQQWQPRVMRTFTFDPTPFTDGIDWDAITARQLAASAKPATLFATQCHSGAFTLYVFNERRLVQSSAGEPLSRNPDVPGVPPTESNVIRDLCTREYGMVGKIISMISPSGDAQGADLAIHDAGDPREWVVVATSVKDTTLQIRRRIYRTDE